MMPLLSFDEPLTRSLKIIGTSFKLKPNFQIENFISSVYYRILEIIENKSFPNDKNLYPGDYIIDIAKKIIRNKSINNFNNYKKIYQKLLKESLKSSMDLIIENLDLLGIKHNNFVYESKLIKHHDLQTLCDSMQGSWEDGQCELKAKKSGGH